MRKLRLIRDNTNFDFIGRRLLFLGFSAVLILLSVGLMATRGINFGVDFRGGILIEARTNGPADLADLRNRLKRIEEVAAQDPEQLRAEDEAERDVLRARRQAEAAERAAADQEAAEIRQHQERHQDRNRAHRGWPPLSGIFSAAMRSAITAESAARASSPPSATETWYRAAAALSDTSSTRMLVSERRNRSESPPSMRIALCASPLRMSTVIELIVLNRKCGWI